MDLLIWYAQIMLNKNITSTTYGQIREAVTVHEFKSQEPTNKSASWIFTPPLFVTNL